jgi:hypothetical protein
MDAEQRMDAREDHISNREDRMTVREQGFIAKLCDERHQKIDTNIDDLWRHNNELVASINGKFNKILFAVMVTLLTVIGSLITIMVTRH